MAEQTDFTLGFIAGLEAAAGFADYMGGDRYQRADYSRRDPAGRLQQTIEAQHLRARSTDFTRGFIAGLEAAAGFADYMGGDRYQRADYSRLATIYRLRANELRCTAPSATPSQAEDVKGTT